MEGENKKLEAIMNKFNELSYEEKKKKVISLVEGLGESDVYSTTLEIVNTFEPNETYLNEIYGIVMKTKLKVYEEGKEQEKINEQKRMQDYMNKLNELSFQQKEKDEKEADELLNLI